MKQSKKSKKDNIGIEIDEIVSDMNRVMDMLTNVDNIDISTVGKNVDKITKDSNLINKEIQKKYNPIIQKLKNNLGPRK
mgnify:CR=1 FL=1